MAFHTLKPSHICPCPGCNRHRCAMPNNAGLYSHCGNNCRFRKCNHSAPTCNRTGCHNSRRFKSLNGGFYSHCSKYCYQLQKVQNKLIQLQIQQIQQMQQKSSGSGSNYRSAHIFPYLNYYRRGNHVLLGLEKGGRYTGQLNFLGGKRDSGERDPCKTLSREVREEFGSALENAILQKNMICSTNTKKAKLFVCKLSPGFSRTSFRPNGEIQSVHWVSIENLKGMKNFGSCMTYDSDRKPHTISKFVIDNIFKLMAEMK